MWNRRHLLCYNEDIIPMCPTLDLYPTVRVYNILLLVYGIDSS